MTLKARIERIKDRIDKHTGEENKPGLRVITKRIGKYYEEDRELSLEEVEKSNDFFIILTRDNEDFKSIPCIPPISNL